MTKKPAHPKFCNASAQLGLRLWLLSILLERLVSQQVDSDKKFSFFQDRDVGACLVSRPLRERLAKHCLHSTRGIFTESGPSRAEHKAQEPHEEGSLRVTTQLFRLVQDPVEIRDGRSKTVLVRVPDQLARKQWQSSIAQHLLSNHNRHVVFSARLRGEV